jgi:hypothetical protein
MVSFITAAQNETKNIMKNLEEVEVTPPKFKGFINATEVFDVGKSSAINNYLAKNFICPVEAAECNKEGTEVIRFTVTPNGWLTRFNVINSVCKEVDTEMIRVLRSTNEMWKPGYNNGKPIAMEYEVSVMIGDYSQDEIVNHFVRQSEKYFTMGSSTLLTQLKPNKALKYFNKSMQYTPNDKGLLLLRGICNYELGNVENAKKDWNRIVSLGGVFNAADYKELADMKGYSEMMNILASKQQN